MSGTRTGHAADVGLVIAVKRHTAAKTRLAPVFSAATRESVVLAMLIDTIGAASAVPALSAITVVTPDEVAADAARRLGARVLADPTPAGHRNPLNNAIAAAEAAMREQTPNVVALQGDLPAHNRRSWPQATGCPGANAASSATGMAPEHQQSFCLESRLTRNSELIPPSAIVTGAIELTGPWPGLRCDIDTPDDLMVARRLGVGAATAQAIGQHK